MLNLHLFFGTEWKSKKKATLMGKMLRQKQVGYTQMQKRSKLPDTDTEQVAFLSI